mmetsp:Transcript_5587/g.16658  ORF Transcript_5587/g.16658 Transcript_5587/m.16658 type:complete len:155 (+) Transcript_5587:88-552(+)
MKPAIFVFLVLVAVASCAPVRFSRYVGNSSSDDVPVLLEAVLQNAFADSDVRRLMPLPSSSPSPSPHPYAEPPVQEEEEEDENPGLDFWGFIGLQPIKPRESQGNKPEAVVPKVFPEVFPEAFPEVFPEEPEEPQSPFHGFLSGLIRTFFMSRK